MHSLNLLIVFVACWALTNFWIVPLLHSGWTAAHILRRVNRAATLTLFEKARDLACVGAITMTLLAVCIGAIELLGEGSAALSKSAMDALSSAYHLLEGFATRYAQLVLWFGVLAGVVALYVAARSAKRKVIQAWQAEALRIRTKFREDPGTLEPLRGSPAYRTQFERLDELQALLRDEAVGLSPNEHSGATREAEQLLDEIAAERSRDTLDLDRALSADIAPPVPSDRPANRLRRLATILFGRRLSADLGLVNKYLTLLLVALLLTALTGWSAAPLANSFRVTVNELRVFALIEDVDREVRDAIARIEPPTDHDPVEPPSESAENLSRASRLVAQAAINHIHTSGLLEPERAGRAPLSRAEFVRAAILNQPFEADVPESVATRLRQDVARGFRDAGRPPVANEQLVTHFTREADDILRDVQARNPRALDSVVDRIKRRYGTSLNPLDVQGSMITKTVSGSLGLVDVNSSDDLAKVAKTFVADVGKAAISEWANAHVKAIVIDGLLGTDVKAAVVERLARGADIQRSPRNSQLIHNLRLASGTGWGASPAEAASDNVSKAVANAVASRYNPGSQATIQRTLGGYSEVFPRALAAAGQMTNASAFATNFAKAVQSPRVRGVIFGRDFRPEFRVRDLAWEFDPAAPRPALLTFRVLLDDAEESFGPFAAGVVNQALRYAADGRVVATTITPGDGNAISRVTYLHPALEDTPLGCRIVEIDRIIDSFTSPAPTDTDQSSTLGQPLSDISSRRAAAWRFIQVASLAELAASTGPRCRSSRLTLDQSEAPPATVMTSHFGAIHRHFSGREYTMHSTALVNTALTCGARDVATIGECLCDATADVNLSEPYWFPEDHTSQVREQLVTGVHDFDSLFRPAMMSEYIHLWLHTTFGVRKNGELLEDEPEIDALDFPLEQIELLNRLLVPTAISDYAKNNLRAAATDFIIPIRDFVLVQRFMRAALSGGLGQTFPIEKLIDLERDTAPYVPVQRTIRWEPGDAEEEFLSVLSESGDEATAAFFEWYRDVMRRQASSSPTCDPAAS